MEKIKEYLQNGEEKLNYFNKQGDSSSILEAIQSFVKANKELDANKEELCLDGFYKQLTLYYLALCHSITKDYETAFLTLLKALESFKRHPLRHHPVSEPYKSRILSLISQLVFNHPDLDLENLTLNSRKEFDENEFKFIAPPL